MSHTQFCFPPIESVLRYSCSTSVHVSSDIHVDADGGCGVIRSIGQSVCEAQEEICDRVHCSQLR